MGVGDVSSNQTLPQILANAKGKVSVKGGTEGSTSTPITSSDPKKIADQIIDAASKDPNGIATFSFDGNDGQTHEFTVSYNKSAGGPGGSVSSNIEGQAKFGENGRVEIGEQRYVITNSSAKIQGDTVKSFGKFSKEGQYTKQEQTLVTIKGQTVEVPATKTLYSIELTKSDAGEQLLTGHAVYQEYKAQLATHNPPLFAALMKYEAEHGESYTEAQFFKFNQMLGNDAKKDVSTTNVYDQSSVKKSGIKLTGSKDPQQPKIGETFSIPFTEVGGTIMVFNTTPGDVKDLNGYHPEGTVEGFPRFGNGKDGAGSSSGGMSTLQEAFGKDFPFDKTDPPLTDRLGSYKGLQDGVSKYTIGYDKDGNAVISIDIYTRENQDQGLDPALGTSIKTYTLKGEVANKYLSTHTFVDPTLVGSMSQAHGFTPAGDNQSSAEQLFFTKRIQHFSTDLEMAAQKYDTSDGKNNVKNASDSIMKEIAYMKKFAPDSLAAVQNQINSETTAFAGSKNITSSTDMSKLSAADRMVYNTYRNALASAESQ